MSKQTEALKLALEALEANPAMLHDEWGSPGNGVRAVEKLRYIAITAIREALAEKPAQQEPYCWMSPDGIIYQASDEDVLKGSIPMYLGKPPAHRKPLTDGDIERIYETPEIAGSCFENATNKAIALARAIEAAHGIKENT